MTQRSTVKAIGPSYQLADRKAASQRSINLFMQQVEGLGEDRPYILASSPGLSPLVTLGATIRGSYCAGDRWFVVAGNTLFEVTTAGATTVRGTLATASGFVSMKHGRDQLVIVDGANGYVLRLNTNAFAPITSPGWRGSNFVDELDGYFVFVDPGTDQFYLSAIDDGSTLDGLDFSSADTQPDNVVTHRVRKRELHLFGSGSIEIWVNSGDADFPFVRYNSTPIDVGLVGPRAVAVAADGIVWVGQTDRGRGYVYELQGHQPVRISTQAVEEALAGATLAECSMWTYHAAGNEFVGINAPGMATTWVYDFSTRQWHERGELVAGAWAPLRAEFVTFVGAAHYAAAGARIYKQEGESIDGAALVRERTWPHLMAPSFEPVSYRGLEVACTTGNGGTMTLEISNDGGHVWGAPLLRSLGAIGQYMQRVRWLNLGSARDRVFRLRCTDAVPLAIYAATVDA
jgi:hypothetical protein